jgi:hypothetical protein
LKNWRSHAVWAVVTVLVAGIWGRVVAYRFSESAPPSAAARPAAAPSPPDAPSDQPRPPGPVAAAKNAPAPAAVSEEQKIRKLLSQPETWLEGFRRLQRHPDRALQIALLRDMALHGEQESVRHNAIYELATLQGREAAPLLMGVLRKEDEHESLRALSARKLGEIGAVEATDLLLQGFRAGKDELPIEAANALFKLGVPGPAGEYLERCAKAFESPDSGVRRRAVEEAGQVEQPSAVPLLIRALRDSSGDVRAEAVTQLSYTMSPEAAAHIEPLTRDPNPDVAAAARRGLETLKER